MQCVVVVTTLHCTVENYHAKKHWNKLAAWYNVCQGTAYFPLHFWYKQFNEWFPFLAVSISIYITKGVCVCVSMLVCVPLNRIYFFSLFKKICDFIEKLPWSVLVKTELKYIL